VIPANLEQTVMPQVNQSDIIAYQAEKPSLKCPNCCRQKGFTLIEIMISLLLGAFVLGGVIQVFVKTRETHLAQEALSRLQENARYAMDAIGRDIRMADYNSCRTGRPKNLQVLDVDLTVLAQNGAVNAAPAVPATPIEGIKNPASSAYDSPDSITVKWSLNGCNDTSGPYDSAGCPTDLTKACGQNRNYYIVQTIVGGNVVGGTLQLATNTNTVAEGVENMQILYGMDDDIDVSDLDPIGDGIADYYADGSPANFPTLDEWRRVVSVRVSLLMSTIEDNVASKPMEYTYNGGTVTANDRRIRRVFTSTFYLRNRAI
jgi:type IV pilus assembly protein PilW